MKRDSAKEAIKLFQNNLKSRQNAILTKTDLQEIVIQNLPDVGLNQRTLIRAQILEYLWEKKMLKEVVFKFPSRNETRYLLGNITSFQLAQSLKPNAYLAHRAAIFINGLCDTSPETIHINVEQSQHHKRNTNTLTQSAIDQAFKNKARVSNEIAEANGIKVCITHGQRTDRLGVETQKGPSGELLIVTSLERTLIDITVRPIYAGGTKEVLKAYASAKGVSLKKIITLLKQLNYVYPYNQAIGFYLQNSGTFTLEDLAPLTNLNSEFDFYLDYRMNAPKYSAEWKIYYPRDLI